METRNSPFSNNEDRISNLPEPLIHDILSFLHMQQAVQTSVLSRRWRYLWTSLPTLNIKPCIYNSPNNIDDIVSFVDRVLMLRDTSDIQRLYLCFGNLVRDYYYDVKNHVNTWILAAVRRNIQELTLKFYIWIFQNYQLPPCFFTCKSLRKLVLDLGYMFESDIILPNSIDLPKLKYLKLSALSINDEKATDKLFSGCPVLESLIISRCGLNLNNISTLQLKHLKLKYNDPDKSDTIRLYAPNLTSFICKGYMSLNYDLENLSSLVTADILMVVLNEEDNEEHETYSELSAELKELYAQNMVKLLRGLRTVKKLRLSQYILEVVSEAPNLLDSRTPQFCNLQRLELRTFLSRGCFHAITYLFKISPNMESLYLQINKIWPDETQMYPFCDEINSNSPDIGDDWEAGLSLPCMLCHLKSVKILSVQGCINELKFLKILFKNTMVLEEVVLFYNCEESEDQGDMARRMKIFIEKLVAFPRASSGRLCVLRNLIRQPWWKIVWEGSFDIQPSQVLEQEITYI